MKPKRIFNILILLTCIFAMPSFVSGAYLKNLPKQIILPDSTVISCFVSGDEFFNYLHDENGFTIIFAEDGFLYYAIKDGVKLIPSEYRVNSVNPSDVGITAYNLISKESYLKIRNKFYEYKKDDPPSKAPHTGTLNNLIIYIRFSDETEFGEDVTIYSDLFNSIVSGANSMRNYFSEVSYNQLTISSTFYPSNTGPMVISYQDSYPRNYFQPYNATSNPNGYSGGPEGGERRSREHNLLKRAVNFVADQVPTSLNIDGDNDGKVDNVCFIIRGDADGWNELLWPHQWSLYSLTVNINGKRVYDYNFQIQEMIIDEGNGVLCHEMFHTFGAPDLYHYEEWGTPIGPWDIMANSQNPPQSMSAYMKFRYGGWIDEIPEISGCGTYSLNPITNSENNCFKILSPNDDYEYFVLEFRKKEGVFESSVPASGLLIYRVNTDEDGNGNRNGPPDELYVFRPQGSLTSNGYINDANFSSDVGRTEFNDYSDPACFLSNGDPGGIDISNIGSIGETITFFFTPELPATMVLSNPLTIGTYVALESITLSSGFSSGSIFKASICTPETFNAGDNTNSEKTNTMVTNKIQSP